MPRPKYTAEQIAIAKALMDAGYAATTIQELIGVTQATIHAIKHDRIKDGSAASRIDADFARRLTQTMRRVRWASLRAMADAFRAAADEMDREVKEAIAQ